MNQAEKLKAKLLAGQGYHNFSFDDLMFLLSALGFTHRQEGSHHVFTRAGLMARINIQSQNGKAKPYQLRQVRRILKEHNL